MGGSCTGLYSTRTPAGLAGVFVFAVMSAFAQAAWGAPSVTVGSLEFVPADTARDPDGTPNNGDEYMDSGGTWDGAAEVTNTTGDTFRVSVTNSAAGTPDPLVDDVAFDIALTLDLPAGFRLPASPFNVAVTASGGDPGAGNCTAPGGGSITAAQAGSTVTFNLPPDTDLPAQGSGTPCTYTFEFGVTPDDAAPFAAAGSHPLDYTFTYNEVDDDSGTEQTETALQSVEVRRGDVIVTKTAVPNPSDPNGGYADGETAEWTVSVFNNGSGGTFAVLVTDTPNANFDPATLQLTPPASPPGTPFPVPQGANQYTLAYLEPGQQVDITVEAQVDIPATATSCPDLRNDVDIEDRLGNTSSAFDSVVLDLHDPLLDYAPPDFTITYGTPETVSFPVNNVGQGSAKNIELDVSGLNGVTITNVSAEWTYDALSTTFIYVGPDGTPSSGDEVIPSGGSSTLQFDAEVASCGGPSGGFLTWTPNYENICGTDFTPPVRNSTYGVNNFPDLSVNITATPTTTNFGQPASYTIDLTGTNVSGLDTVAGADNDWTVRIGDFPGPVIPDGVGNGNIPSVPAGTLLTVAGLTYNDSDTNIAVSAGDSVTWRGDRDDLTPLPALTIDFIVDSSNFCPPDPPVTFTNSANLEYSSCGINIVDSATITANDSPIDSASQNFSLAGGLNPPFQTGRPDTNLTPGAGEEPNEGERITFVADYRFPAGYPGVWSGSAFAAEMGTVDLAEPLQLAFSDGNGNSLPDTGEVTGVIVEVVNPNGPDYGPTNLPVGTGAGEVTINAGGDIEISDLAFIEAAIGTASMAETTLTVTYHVTAPEGSLDANLQPLDATNIGIFDERVTLSVQNNPFSCSGDINFVQGIGTALERAQVFGGGNIDETNDAGACGPTTATVDVFGPAAGDLNADNFRILLEGTDYVLPNSDTDFTFGGAGNLAALNPTITFPGSDVVIEIPNDGDNLTGNSTITFPVTLSGSASGRSLPVTMFYDSNHTSPDIGNGWDDDEDYCFPLPGNCGIPFPITGPTPTASLDVEFFPPNVILGDPDMFADVDPGSPGQEGVFNWRVRITNTGTSTVSGYVFTNEVPPGFLPYRSGSSPAADAGALGDPLMVWSGLPDLAPGGSTEIIVAIGLAQNGGCNVANPNQTTVHAACTDGTELYDEPGPAVNFPVIDLVLEHQNTSFCELCRDGTVELDVRNEGASDLYNVTVTEDLAGSGLEYVPNSTEVFVEGSGGYVGVSDHASTTSTQIVWDSSVIADLGQLFSDLNGTPSEMTIRFDVRSSSANPENLVNAGRQITASGEFDLFCGDPGLGPEQDIFTVPLHQPQPQVDKQGRNHSARQGAADYSDPVFGGTDDIVVWRVDVANAGGLTSADLEDLLVNDTISPATNFTLQHVCPTEADADARANSLEAGTAPSDNCIAFTSSLDVDSPFGEPPADDIDVTRGGNAFVYYLGTILNNCTDETNSTDIEWGCEVNAPAGGINADGSGGALSAGLPAGDDDDTADLSTAVDPNGVTVAQTFTGTNPVQPVGTKGVLTITVTNNSGGTVRNVVLTDTLPADYELDLTAPNTLVVNPAFGSYPGLVDDYTLDATNPNQPVFTFTSSTQGTPVQSNLLRNGDQLTLTLGVIRVRPFDDVNDPEVRTENTGDGTDPDYSPASDDNTVSLQFENTCGTVFTDADSANLPSVENVSIDPEDIDVDINPADPNLLYILSDPTATLDLDVLVTNNGGHDAADYDTYVTVGLGMELVGGLPSGCALSEPPPAELGMPPSSPSGILPPAYNDAESNTYRCVSTDPLPPGATDTFSFTVQRRLPVGTSGDLTFRADVLGRSTQDDGSDPPDRGAAGYPYYSKDNILARIIGFNLLKTLDGACSEDNPPPVANQRVIIGEECTYHVEAEWFGFATPGFGNIEIRNARIYEGGTGNNPPPAESPVNGTPNIPDALDGQGLLSVDTSASTGAVTVAEQNPAAPGALAETGIAWRLNHIQAIGNTEERFIARLRSRTLNDDVNNSAAPNLHGALRRDEINARFDVYFTATGESFTFDENSDGYPPDALRQVDLRVIEPSVTITKEICNESQSIANNPADSGASCQPWVGDPDAVNGDSDDNFIYRLTVANADTTGGYQHAPAYDVAVTDTFDGSDQVAPFPFATDGLDNDGDGLVDGADTDGEGTVNDTTLVNGTPAVIDFDGDNTAVLDRIDPGASVEFFYRARLDSSVTPTQQLTNTADGAYDSLEGDAGNQSAPQGTSGTLQGAREYTIPQVQAVIEIDNITVNPGSKEFLDTARRDAGLVGGSCASPCTDEDAVIGEEVRVELEFTVPLSELNDFTLVDNLPAGMECVEAMDVTLPAFPGTDPGFMPGGTFAATACNASQASWDFGDQVLQGSGGGTTQYTVQAQFIARVQNVAGNDDGVILRNGGSSTAVEVTYRNASNTLVMIPIEEARLTIQEPDLVITKTLDPVPPNASVDAADTFDVTVQIDNAGTSPAYNIELLDTLDTSMTFVAGSVGGANPPDVIDLSVPATPRFAYNNPLPAGNSLTFTFQVQANTATRPLEQLLNTIDARFTSLPDNTVALNGTGSIGAEGAADGMRNGQVPPAGDPVNDYEAQGSDFETVPGLAIVKNDLDPAVVPTIGARKHFQVVIDLPEGTADDVVVNDNLNAGGASFVLENNAGFDVTYSFQGIATVNGAAVGGFATPADVETALAGFTATDGATGVVSWDFGQIVTDTEDDSTVNNIDPRIVIDYYARIDDSPGTTAGVNLQNAASVDFTDGENGGTVTVNAPPVGPFTVVEPDLEVAKDFTDLPPPTPAGTVIQGTTAEFVIRATNAGGATAWDATVLDMLPNLTDAGQPGGMCDSAPSITQIEVNGRTLDAGSDYTTTFTPPTGPADPHCEFSVLLTPTAAGPPADDARIAPGETLLIRYETMLDPGTPNSSDLTNIAGATQWFSLDTDGVSVPAEVREYTRTLTLPPDPDPGTTGTVDHEDAETVQTLSPILDVTKSVENLTAGQNPAVNASPGDTLRYTIVVDNTGPVDANDVRVTDDPDALNVPDFPDGYFENSPGGTLRNVTVPAGATDNSQQNGGVVGSGLLDVDDITVPAGASVTITFDIDVEDPASPLPRAFIRNRADVDLPGFTTLESNVTQTEIINTAADFRFEKSSQDLTGDPNVLATGDTLRYTMTIKNIGSQDPATGISHSVNTTFRDQIPANTTYVAGSTRLNGAQVSDPSAGVPPFAAGMPVNSPDVAQAGFMTADPNLADNSNVATVSFEVTVDSGLVNGTIISNQGVLTGQNQAIAPFTPLPFRPVVSDDPSTVSIPDDPTREGVGSGVNVDALKTVQVISGGDAIPDPGETLRYTIIVVNRGNAAADNARLIDPVPAGTAFVSGSVTLNGIAVPDGGTSPLAGGMAISSSDRTPPLPSPGDGVLSAGATATVEFDVTITAGVGTVISNQGTVRVDEQPDEPTDADGNDENGDQPTDLVVGGEPRLEISKEVVIVGGGTVQPDGELEYRIRVENSGNAPADNIAVTDPLPAPTAYVAGSGEINGAPAGVSVAGGTLTADYSGTYGTLSPGDSFIVTFRVRVNAQAQAGDDIDNTATVSWDNGAPPAFNASDTANVDVGGAPGVVNIGGRVWNNYNHNDNFDSGEPPLEGWRVRVFVNNPTPGGGASPLAATVTDDQGRYSFNGLAPVDPGDADGAYTVTFSVSDDPDAFPAGSNVALGDALSDFGNPGLMLVNNMNVDAGRNAQNESLPVDPMGVVYNSVTREPVQGARIRLLDADGDALPAVCFNTPDHLDPQQGQITSVLGLYRFDLNFGASGECPGAGADYFISAELPDGQGGFLRSVSNVIPPEGGVLDVPACPDGPNDRVPSPPPDTCEVQEQAVAPDPFTPPGLNTRYFLDVNLASGPEELLNNHVPVDDQVGELVSITKETPLKNVVRGQLVPYVITVTNPQNFPIGGMEIRDFFPAGFKYVEGSATIEGEANEPDMDASTFDDEDLRAGTLSWDGLAVSANSSLTLKLLLVVGSGTGEGEYVNQAQAFITGLSQAISGRAGATVRVVPDPTFDCSDVIGKVFDDLNNNGYADAGEPGIAGARVATAQGLLTTTDEYGRFHVACAAVPNPDRGSNFILKLDERTLPSGYRMTTENPRVQRLTRGKVAKFNFGASLHRVVRLDLADAAFESADTAIRGHWQYVIDDLFEQLQGEPSVLRITYLGDTEPETLARKRLDKVKALIEQRWHDLSCCYDLSIETDLFWRRGKPVQ